MNKIIDENSYIKIVEAIACTAAYQIPGVASLSNEASSATEHSAYAKKGTNSVTAYFRNNALVIDIYLNAYHSYKVPELSLAIQQKVIEEVEKATAFKVKSVNIHVVGIVFPS